MLYTIIKGLRGQAGRRLQFKSSETLYTYYDRLPAWGLSSLPVEDSGLWSHRKREKTQTHVNFHS